jgi:hypothetical protein
VKENEFRQLSADFSWFARTMIIMNGLLQTLIKIMARKT